jgi:hypothetical protein
MDDIEKIHSALLYIPPDDWETCVLVGKAIKSELGEKGFPIWVKWVRSGGWLGGTATWVKPADYIEPVEALGPPDGWRPVDGDWWSGEGDDYGR